MGSEKTIEIKLVEFAIFSNRISEAKALLL